MSTSSRGPAGAPRALVYTRVSNDPRGGGRSVEQQEQECSEWAAREGWVVLRVVRETGSASRYARKGREQWQAVVDAVDAGECDVLVTWEASRATRDLTVYAALRDGCARAGVLWAYSGRVYDLRDRDARFRTGLDALLAEDEAARTSERVQRGVRANALKGRPHGKALYGYRRVYDPQTRDLLRIEPHPDEAPIVQEAARRVLAGESCYAIAKDLNDRRVSRPRPPRTRPRNDWDPMAVKRLAIWPAYAGLRQHRGEILPDVEVVWPALIDLDDHRRLVATLTDPRRRTQRDGAVKHLLSGLARCGVCGGPLRVLKQNSGRRDGAKATYPAYLCADGGFHVARKLDVLEAYVTDVVVARLERPDVLELLGPDVGADPDRAEAESECSAIAAQLAEARAAAGALRLSVASLVELEGRLLPALEESRRRAQRPAGLDPVVGGLVDATAVRPAWESLTVTQRRQVLRALLEIRVHPVGRGRRVFDPAAVELTWRS